MESPDQMNPCAICLGDMGAGGGKAIFVAECSHTFHFHCISSSVANGHLVCPLCKSHWRELPFVRPGALPPPPPPPGRSPTQPVDRAVFDDDEQVGTRPADAAHSGPVVVNTHTKFTAMSRDSSHNNFAVLVHLKAPGNEAAVPHAPLDLVMVLDVSGSMGGRRIALLKQAMRFVIDVLGPDDRLCVVSFAFRARRETRLARMSDAGKALCLRAVESLTVRAGTRIVEGLRTAAKVLDERRYRKGGVSSVVLLSDGQDKYTPMIQGSPNYAALVPPSFARTGSSTDGRTAPIHTFGFGNSHDAVAMHAIAEAAGGTYSFIENEAVVQDAFAQCVGGLLSTVVQDVRLAVACVHPGVRVGSVKSGPYESHVDEYGRAAWIVAGELYADEDRRFLLFLVVPKAGETDGDLTTLIKVTCTYRDAAAGAEINVTADDTILARPGSAAAAERSVEVEREIVRVEATEGIAAARAAAERGAHREAVEILENRRRAVAQLGAAGDGNAMIAALETELQGMHRRVWSQESYESSGRASMLAGMSAHMHQRGSSLQLELPPLIGFDDGEVSTAAASDQVSTLPYATPAMLAMLSLSRNAREAAAESGEQRHEAGEEAEG